jgi:hypothetical protein
VYQQNLNLPEAIASRANDNFGFSVAADHNMVVVGAFGRNDRTISVGLNKNSYEELDTGAVYVFRRLDRNSDYTFFQQLEPSNIRKYDAFGTSVAISNDKILVGALEGWVGELRASRAIMEIRTEADYNMEPVGTGFKLLWLEDEEGRRSTRQIKYDTTAVDMRKIIEEDLRTGRVSVSRSRVDQYNRGYSWSVTFIDLEGEVSLFEGDASELTGTNARVVTRIINQGPPAVRGKTHIFKADDINGAKFIEEAFLMPFDHQPLDRCGFSVSLTEEYAMTGCPNRDYVVPNKNTGSAMLFHTSLLNVKFESKALTVVEGGTLTYNVRRRNPSVLDILFYIETFDRNHDRYMQDYVGKVFGLSENEVDKTTTYIDATHLAGTAVARSQWYGSLRNESIYVDGMYDYRAISDYVPLKEAIAFLNTYTNISTTLITSPDTILELPDEKIAVLLHSPGLFPSPLGNLYSVTTILDNDDGVVGSESLYEKCYAPTPESRAQMGSSVAIDSRSEVMVSGSPYATVDGEPKAGSAYVFKRYAGSWTLRYTLKSPHTDGPVANAYFGSSVAIGTVINRQLTILAVGEPSRHFVHVWVSEDGGLTFNYETSLTSAELNSPQHLFGARGTLTVSNDHVLVGAPGLECIFAFLRFYNTTTTSWEWMAPTKIQSLDFDYDIIFGRESLHRQKFGTSLAMSERDILVGAPYGNYDKQGSDLVEVDLDTEGSSIESFARGKAYVFHRKPEVQTLTIRAPLNLIAGDFKIALNHRGMTTLTEELSFAAVGDVVKAALEALGNIDQVSVRREVTSVDGENRYSWLVTFISEFSLGSAILEPHWNNPGHPTHCSDCDKFSSSPADPLNQVTVTTTDSQGDWFQQQGIVPGDRRNGDRFGWSVDIDGDQIIVGSPYNGGVSGSTWDFETGSLEGWARTGTAFDHQPTYGDNPYLRPNYVLENGEDERLELKPYGVKSNLEGRYFIGTYELRPGSTTEYSLPHASYPQGSYQGDGPMGTLSSQLFTIKGNWISFLIGGGCNMYNEYIELVADGITVLRATGKCDETMDRQFLDTTRYVGRTGQLRVVDAARGPWGHISLDDIRFSWDMSGSIVNGTLGRTSKAVFGGPVETPLSGAAYLFKRRQASSTNLCLRDLHLCEWSEEQKLLASDKRERVHFGTSVALNNEAGVVAVGAPGASNTGFFKETPSPYPYQDAYGKSDAALLHFPLTKATTPYYTSLPTYAPQPTGAGAVWHLLNSLGIEEDDVAARQTGAVYVYAKEHYAALATGEVTRSQKWSNVEHAKVQPPDVNSGDSFGQSVALSGRWLVGGSTGQDALDVKDTGAAYVYDAAFASLSMASPEYRVLEGNSDLVKVKVLRDRQVFNGEVIIEYSTSDLTAKGIDADLWAQCDAAPAALRGPLGCGDYRQTSGLLTIPAGAQEASFNVPIVNDLCRERFLEYLQVTVSVPGSASLQGEKLLTKVRIDDDDFTQKTCNNT